MSITLDDLIAHANDLLGPADDRADVNPEYVRALVEMVASFLPAPESARDMVSAVLGDSCG